MENFKRKDYASGKEYTHQEKRVLEKVTTHSPQYLRKYAFCPLGWKTICYEPGTSEQRIFQIQRMKYKAHRTGVKRRITGKDRLALLEPY